MIVFGGALPDSAHIYKSCQHPAAGMKRHHNLPAIQTFLWSGYGR